MRALLDTSVFIASEEGRSIRPEAVPDEAAISAVTLAELMLGVHLASSEAIRGRRLSTLTNVQATYAALPIDERVAAAFAELVATARAAGRRPKVQDAWIAAAARAHGVPVCSQDSDFDAFEGIEVIRV